MSSRTTTNLSPGRIAINDAFPLPSAPIRVENKRKGRQQASVVLTSSPYKNKLLTDQEIKNKVVRKVGVKTALCFTKSKKAKTGANKGSQKKKLTKQKNGGDAASDSDEEACSTKNKRTRTITKKTSKGKATLKKKNRDDGASDSGEEGWPCLNCNEPYERSHSREKWIRCNECKKWSHLLCTAVEKEQLGYICEICLDNSD